ncbi:hypothetical protein PoB_006108700 [Plakobranchus ocellatus]|uniref:Uncharacterized protein n=1 Tax=Plakobranchus ocellatus TaxID=259542 RepID=A0AAV4CRS4_9GAST|nr:hypothetical protein PoB_006108700 [Plakobranchus ocellatus]
MVVWCPAEPPETRGGRKNRWKSGTRGKETRITPLSGRWLAGELCQLQADETKLREIKPLRKSKAFESRTLREMSELFVPTGLFCPRGETKLTPRTRSRLALRERSYNCRQIRCFESIGNANTN